MEEIFQSGVLAVRTLALTNGRAAEAALKAFADQANMQLLYNLAIVDKLTAHPVTLPFTAAQIRADAKASARIAE